MKYLILASAGLLLAILLPQSTFACSCAELKDTRIVTVGATLSPAEVEKWQAEQSDIALFTGRVTKIETIQVKRSQWSGEKSPMKKVTVAVQNYWLGVKPRKMVIFTGLGHGDCGVPYHKGATYLFLASLHHVTHLLETNVCEPTSVKDKAVISAFDEIFGRSKSFN